uniref:ATP synthase F0 subunit 8 n=1 Tax=Tettigades lacertosa TaxID=1986886 RepID=A0A3S5GL44_9HEMI|nr:ATP synthase F0 subunit 8 [Tettigades lacertosa]AWV83942.1 ATP synthase F0 subunit 8 [Tettigades lacertosa]AWV83968.1 ATP synthase F0 subunit 8 [Tettigades lacertosa]AWV83981.1 ATP synthase F0 subunit 8 [Tettigades lacertosa]AWV83994.1 ATP synthase F0 subunit 8 [Tettigades lacertosa]
MPQMSPMYWLLLVFYFIFTLLLMMMFIYFFYSNMSKKCKIDLLIPQFNWMW